MIIDQRPGQAKDQDCASTRTQTDPGWQPGRWLPAVAVLACLLIILLSTGTSVADMARYAAYFVLAVALPGTLLYRAIRRAPHSFVEDAAVGAALGLIFEIAVYVVASVTGWTFLRWLWAVLVVVAFAAVPSLRRHWRPKGYQQAPLAWSWTVAAVTVFFLTYLTFAYLRPNQPVPVNGPQHYLVDQLYFLGLVGEAKNHFPLTTPSLAGEFLPYHWFSFAHLATGSTLSGVDTTVVMFRLALPVMAVLSVVLLAVAGWRVTGRPWVGAVAAALMFAVGELTAGTTGSSVPGTVTAYFSWSSLSMLYGTVMTLPLIMIIAEKLQGKRAPGAWILLALFALAAPGAKSTILPITLAAVGFVGFIQLVRRRPALTPWLIAGILLAAQLVATAVIFDFQTHSLQLGPLEILRNYLATPEVRPLWKEAGVIGFVTVGYLVSVCTRLAGIPVLAWLGRRGGRLWGDTEWFLLGALIAGLSAVMLLWHSAWSQHFFVCTAWPFASILSATGLVALIEKRSLSRRSIVFIVAVTLVIATALGLALPKVFDPVAATEIAYHRMFPVYQAAIVVAVLAAVIGFALLIASKWNPRLRPTIAVTILSVVLGAGLSRLPWDAYTNPNAGTGYHILVTPERAAAARWLRDNSSPNDLIATNAHRFSPEPVPGWSIVLWMSAFTERRFLLESWGYTPTAVRDSGEKRRYGPPGEFWDADLLARNDAAITDPTAARIAWLRSHGVRWIMVDRRFGAESPELARFATLRQEADDLAVYELPDAAPDANRA